MWKMFAKNSHLFEALGCAVRREDKATRNDVLWAFCRPSAPLPGHVAAQAAAAAIRAGPSRGAGQGAGCC